MPTQFKKGVKSMIDSRSSEWLDRQVVRLGKDATQVIETGVPGVLWARLANGRPIKVHTTAANVPSRFDLHLVVGRRRSQPSLWRVIYTLEDYDGPAGGGELTYHRLQHQEEGGDRLALSWKQIVARSVRVKDATGFIVRVFGDLDLTVNGWVLIPTQDLDLSSYVPTTGALFVAIESDDDGVLTINDGTPFAAPGIGTEADYPVPAAGQYTRAHVLLYEGQTALLDKHIMVPKPPSFNPLSSGGSGTPGGIDGEIQFNDGGAFGGAKLKYSHAGASSVLESERTGDHGDPLEIKGADGDNDGSGGELIISGGNTPGDGGAGTLNLSGGDAGGSGDGGSVLFTPGSSVSGAPGRIQFRAPGNVNKLELEVNGISAARQLSAPDASGVIATQAYADTKQPLDSDLTAIAGLSPSNDDIIQRKAGAWTNRTIAQLITDLTSGLGALFAPIAKGVTNGDSHDHAGGDGAQIDHGGLAGLSDDDHTQYVRHNLSTASNDFLVGSGSNTWIKKTLAETITILRTSLDSIFAPIANGVTNGDSHNHVGGDGAALSYSYPLSTYLNAQVPGSSTRQTAPTKPTLDTVSNNVPSLQAGTLSNLTVRTSTTQPASGTGALTVQLYINNVASSMIVTIANGSAGGTYADNTHTEAISAGDVLRWECINAASGLSAAITNISMLLARSTS